MNDDGKLKLALMLLPGFLSRKTFEYFSGEVQLNDFDTLSASLAFSLVCVGILGACASAISLIRRRPPNASSLLQMNAVALLMLSISVAIPIGWISAWIDTNDYLFYISPNRTISRSDPWTVLLNTCNDEYIQLQLKDGSRYSGTLHYYSSGRSENKLVLRNLERLPGPGQTSDQMPKIHEKTRYLFFEREISLLRVSPRFHDRFCGEPMNRPVLYP